MYEVELTAVVKNRPEILKNLKKHSNKPAFTVIYEDFYFDKKDTLKNKAFELRLRRKNYPDENRQTCWLTLKTAPFDLKSGSKPEFETEIADYEATKAIFEGLGYKEDISYIKNVLFFHASYENQDLEISLVELPEVEGHFIEVEIATDYQDQTDALLKILYDFLGLIGLSENDLTKITYQEAVRRSRKNENNQQ